MSFFHRLTSNKFIIFIAGCILMVLFSMRIIGLEADLPPWGIVNYQPIDEGSYSILALNQQNYGTINPDKNYSDYPFYTPPHIRTNIIGNAVSYLGIKLLGDNYFGLRGPYVLWGFLNFILFAFILVRIRKMYDNKGSLWAILGAMLYLANDFVFLVASRVAEPSIIRMFFVQLIVYTFIKLDKSFKLRFFLIGALVTLSVFGVYITNIFLYLACLLSLILVWIYYGKKVFFKSLTFFIIGSLIVFLVSEVYYFSVWKTSGIINSFNAVFDFSKVKGYGGASTIKSLVKTFIRFFSANSILYNIPLFFAMLLALPTSIMALKRRKDICIGFILAIPLSFLFQTFFSEDFIVRKFVIVYTSFIFITYIGYCCKNDYIYYFQKFYVLFTNISKNYKNKLTNSNQSKLKTYYYKLISNNEKKILPLVINIYILIVLLLCISIVAFRLFIVNDGTAFDFQIIDKAVIIIFELLVVVFLALYLIYAQSKKDILSKGKLVKIIILTFVFSFGINSYYAAKYVFTNQTYSDKELMIELGKTVGNNYVLGEYENGFTLYNDIKPVLETYENLKKQMENNKSIMYFDYYDNGESGMRNFFDNVIFADSNYTVVPIKEFKREFQTFGKKRSMALYKVVPKYQAVKMYMDISKASKKESPYSNYYGNYIGDIKSNIYVNIYGSIYGDINADIYGDVFGDIYGNVNGKIFGTVHGKIYGK